VCVSILIASTVFKRLAILLLELSEVLLYILLKRVWLLLSALIVLVTVSIVLVGHERSKLAWAPTK
jgi:hypothetical protein